jgi:hypothetical protein
MNYPIVWTNGVVHEGLFQFINPRQADRDYVRLEVQEIRIKFVGSLVVSLNSLWMKCALA